MYGFLMTRPWKKWPISDCGEALRRLPSSFKTFLPHPYYSLGAPYEDAFDPFKLREGVVDRLIVAEEVLQKNHPELCLVIFDGWRSIEVQSFMVDYVINKECLALGLKRNESSQALAVEAVVNEIGRFWSPPSTNPCTPPPHSTGAAVDLTLSYLDGSLVEMGGEIDAIGQISEPGYYAEISKLNPDSSEAIWHKRRSLLSHVMNEGGFAQHPNEWWHFSYGDQLWAWRNNAPVAIYGRCSPSKSSSITA